MVRNSSQDALDQDTFRELVVAADDLPEPMDAEAMLILMAGGRLGMRAGEITHMRDDWINWRKQQIKIPTHEPCDCGYCRGRAKQATTFEDGGTLDEEFRERWKPKTDHSARAIPFGFSEEVEATLEAFFDIHDRYPHSRVSINRRVARVAEAAGLPPDDIYPHALRATAGTWHAYRGVPAVALQSLMGWADLKTAQKYIRLSGGATAEALEKAHSD